MRKLGFVTGGEAGGEAGGEVGGDSLTEMSSKQKNIIKAKKIGLPKLYFYFSVFVNFNSKCLKKLCIWL